MPHVMALARLIPFMREESTYMEAKQENIDVNSSDSLCTFSYDIEVGIATSFATADVRLDDILVYQNAFNDSHVSVTTDNAPILLASYIARFDPDSKIDRPERACGASGKEFQKSNLPWLKEDRRCTNIVRESGG